jgi:hypothetical protein
MATKTLSGYLRDPLGEFSEKDKVKFQALTTEGTVIAGSVSVFDIDSTGYYEITVQYGEFEISTRNRYTSKWTSHGVYTVDASTTATSLPVLIGASTPSSDADLVEVQDLIQQAATAAKNAEQHAEDSDGYDTYITGAFESETCQVAGDVAIPEPDFYVPFNDGLRIESGYGTHDQIDVSAAQDGSVMVDLPSMSASYTSSSGTYYIDKSGQLVEASEAPITKEGVQLHPAFSNSITYSNFDGGYPLGTASTDWSDINAINGFTLAKFESGIEFSDYSISGEDCFSFSCVVSTSGLVNSSDTVRLRIEARGGTTAAVNCYVYDDLSVIMDSSAYFNLYTESLGDNLIRIHILYDDNDGALLNTSARVAVYSSSTDETSYPYYGEFQLSPGIYSILPIIKTESSSVAASATYVTFPQANNVSAGEANTLVMDIVTSGSSDAASIFRAYTDSRLYAYAQDDEITLVWYTESGTQQSLTYSGVTPLEKHRVCFINSLDELYIAVDGEVKASLSITSSVNFRNISNFQLGVHTFAPSCVPFISDFKIYHSALSEDQVKALGVAQ